LHDSLDANQTIIVASVHLIGDPKEVIVRLQEQQTLLNTMHNIMRDSKGTTKSCIICGDFNANENSSSYAFMTQGQVPTTFEDQEVKKQFTHYQQLTHPISGLRSALATALGREPPYTFITDRLSKTVDFIWYSSPLQVSAGFFYEEWKNNTMYQLPSETEPSDHIAICAEFI
jgi:mRNA deadenylase 3'-5' endonuclease subunit Ccr4